MNHKDFDFPNREGLSWTEWLQAAGYDLSTIRPGADLTVALIDAWKAGEDPCEYRVQAPKRTDEVTK